MDLDSRSKPSHILLPILELSPIKHALGNVRHIVDLGGQKRIVSIEDFKTSPRITEKLFTLSDGKKILISKNRKTKLSTGVNGVLMEDQGGLKWIAHEKLEEIELAIAKNGIENTTIDISNSWSGKFVYSREEYDEAGQLTRLGLRPPQIGGLHAIGAHWSLYHLPATIVMPTGTGKTETMLATLTAYNPGTLLVIVPSQVLRDQTAKKFMTLGLLRKLGNLLPDAKNPIVGIIKKRPRSAADLDIFEKCNVIVSTMSALGDESSKELIPLIADKISALIVDEAHHIAAKGWSSFREHFKNKKVLQFTATPYRRDGKLVDGKVIFEYPLHAAQNDGYFKKITFESVYEIDQEGADRAIAEKAVDFLRQDILSGKDHLMMARCANIDRALVVHEIYKEIASDLNPILIHSEEGEAEHLLKQLTVIPRKSRIVVCVNMLGEGFDLPQLKVAAIHDTHKSLAILLQFTGRFTRSAADNIGEATVVANIADQNVSSALERLYSEDADWNQLLSEFSSEAVQAHSELISFLNASERIDEPNDEEKIEISHHLLQPTFSTLLYNAYSFSPKRFFEGIPQGTIVHRVWIHQESNTLYFITRNEPAIKWTRSRKIRDKEWHIFVLHYDDQQSLLFLSSSDKSSNHEKIARAVGGTNQISGDVIFRSLGNINRLIFQNVGVKKHGRRNLRYALYTGADVAEALSISERAGSEKANLNGTGWENGEAITIGCSYKGRVWARQPGSIPELVKWSKAVGGKIKDSSIDTTQIIANVLIPEEVDHLPDKEILSIDWPVEILRQSEERVILKKGQEERSVSLFDIEFVGRNPNTNQVEFQLVTEPDNIWVSLILTVGGEEGFKVNRTSKDEVKIHIGKLEVPIENYLSDYPPLIRFVDISELDGNLFIKPQSVQDFVFPDEFFEIWDWEGVSIKKESIWKDGAERQDSIQWKVAQEILSRNYDVVFDDDSAGEAADLVCFKEEQDHIRLLLIHCKFSKGETPGERVNDVVEVCSQAVRSAKWKWKFKDLCRHVLERDRRLSDNRGPRFLKGTKSDMNKFVKLFKYKEVKPEIVVVQPGLSKVNHTPDQRIVLAAAYSYLKETIGVDLDVICSE